MRNLTLLALYLALFLLRTSYGQQRLVVFGDSLSDIGNSFAFTDGLVPPGPPAGAYGKTFDPTGPLGPFLGRFTDGQNWVDYFPGIAQRFGVEISQPVRWLQNTNQSNDNATDFAVGGSTSRDLSVNNGTLPGFPNPSRRIRRALSRALKKCR